ncbi:MAG: hypothetical protein IJN13_05125 [Bacilli bacterium]|nr:hypothetical protein [Bacilli bacterium]
MWVRFPPQAPYRLETRTEMFEFYNAKRCDTIEKLNGSELWKKKLN